MTVELRPLGVKCNLRCNYCYQNPQRDTGNVLHRFDFEAMKRGIEREGGPFTLFGGEPLLVPISELERLWSWGFGRFGRNGIQTNGTLITDQHVDLFRRFNVRVGISIDGPGDLNDARWAGSLERTRDATAKSEAAIVRLCQEGLPPSLIVTLHQGNALPKKLIRLSAWFRELDALGVKSVRLHLLEAESDDIRNRMGLSNSANVLALLHCAMLARSLRCLRFPLFDDIRRLLQGDDRRASCVWNACDPYTTRAVHGIEGNGQRSNCGRTNKDGVGFIKGDSPGYERYIALYHTPQEVGGCAGCRYFAICKGQCPGTAIDGDWRNRSEHCEVWKALFSHFEAELIAAHTWVLTRSKHRRAVEAELVRAWRVGQTRRLYDIAKALRKATNEAKNLEIDKGGSNGTATGSPGL